MTIMIQRVKDKAIIVTGSTQGIGRDIAYRLAAEGANVTIVGRNQDLGNQVVESIRKQYDVDALYVEADISNVEQCHNLVNKTIDRFGGLYGLCNNAGVFPRFSLAEISEEKYEMAFGVNVKGAFFCSQAAINHFIATGKGGSIVNVGSTHARWGYRHYGAYSVSKGGLYALTMHIARNYASDNVRSNSVLVGWVLSEGELAMRQSLGENEEMLLEFGKKWLPMGGHQTGADNAAAVAFLMSKEARFITGCEIDVSGGTSSLAR